MLTAQTQVLLNLERTPDSNIFLLRLEAPEIVEKAVAGQFVQLQINQSYDPLLRRPFCIYNIDENNGKFEILYQIVGKGTKMLCGVKPGDELSVLGPLGNGYQIESDAYKPLLIGGGMGWAALNQLASELKNSNREFYSFCGAKNHDFHLATGASEIVSADFSATDDGSFGHHGFITERVEKWLEVNNSDNLYIFACGPIPMLRAVQKLAGKFNLSGQMSLEARMACGFGVCLGCAIKKARAEGYYKVCKDGPVFNLDEVDLSE